MLSSKLQRSSGSSSSGGQSATSSALDNVITSLAGFWRLPSELRDLTLQLACYRRPQTDTSDDTRSRWQLHLDGPTVANLAAVSRAFHTTFHHLLYAHVTLECPSRLAEFHASLVSRPSNAALVKSISLGPSSDFKEGWWPVRIEDEGADAVSVYWGDDEDNGMVFLRTSLDLRDKDLERLPQWVDPESEWAYQPAPRTCQEQAISAALCTALQHLNINPALMFVAGEEEYIGINQWRIRLFEFQAIFDLYLYAMRRVDDESKRPVRQCDSKESPCRVPNRCLRGECGHYPALQLSGFDQLSSTMEEASKTSKDDGQTSDTKLNVQGETGDKAGGDGASVAARDKGNEHDPPVCIVTREQVLNHISRRGASTDFFEHPLVYARSNMHILGIKDRKVIVDYEFEQTEDLYSFDSEGGGSESDADSTMDEESQSSPSYFGSSISWPSLSQSSPQEKAQGVLDHARHRGIISLARSVLRRTYRLQNLSLSGSFHSLLSSSRIFVLRSIRSLSVGPFCPPSSAEYCVAWVKLPSLEKLRICGSTIAERTAADVAGEDEESWKKLREAEWDFGYPGEGDSIPAARLYKLLIRLHGWKIPQSERSEKHRRRIKVHLPPHLIGPVLDSARPPQLRAVWSNGSAVRGTPHILHVVESRAVKTVKDVNGLQELEQDVEVLRRDSRLWWEERAFECKDGTS